MKQIRRTATAFLLLVLFMAGALCASADGGDKTTYNRYNIVLVMDTSGSMNSTDKEGLRFEAIGKFVALLAEKGNRVGAVVFNDQITYRQDLIDVNGKDAKKALLDGIEGAKAEGLTNIGKGLLTAVEMLDAGENPDLPSIILLLSDGNTSLSSNEERDLSLEQKADAIQAAREAGYKIYTVSLNADRSANSAELSQIAKATGGEFEEVSEASDLEDVFGMYYSIIFSSKLDKGDEKAFPSSGEISDAFEIPSVGVEEVNIVLSGRAKGFNLTDPSGRQYTQEEMDAVTYSSDTFNVIKVEDPPVGLWNYRVFGEPDDVMQINIVYNTNISAYLSAQPDKEVYMAGDELTVTASLLESGKAIPGGSYGGFSASLTVTDKQGGSEVYDMSAGEDGFTYTLSFPQTGTYIMKARITGHDYDLATGSISVNVDNTPPSANGAIKKTVLLWPFSDNKTAIDLAPGASDAQDSVLRYEVESGAFLEEEYEIRDGVLEMSGYSLAKGSLTIRAYDSGGAYCTFDVIITTVNMTVLGIILLAGGIVIALAVIITGLWIALNKRFMGACYVTQFDNDGGYYEEVRREKGRGRIPLSSFNLKDSGFNARKCYFQATGKDYVHLCMNETVYGDGRYGKKIRVDGGGYEVAVSKDEAMRQGIKVRFVSRLNNTQFY